MPIVYPVYFLNEFTEGAVVTTEKGSHRSRDHSIAHWAFPIGSPLEPSLYL